MTEKIVLVDLDKTLVDVNEQLVHKMCEMLDTLGLAYDKERLQYTTDLYGELRQLGIDTDNVEFWKKFNDIDNRKEGIEKKRIRLFPHTIYFLEAIVDHQTAIVSDTPRIKAEPEIRTFGLDKYFDVFSHWDESKAGKGKPHPLLALEALEKLEVNSGQIYFVGDDMADIGCAQNLEKELNRRVIKIHVKRHGNCLMGADFTVPDLRYAAEIIEGD